MTEPEFIIRFADIRVRSDWEWPTPAAGRARGYGETHAARGRRSRARSWGHSITGPPPPQTSKGIAAPMSMTTAWAILTAALALLGKIAFDARSCGRERQAVAAALAGEITGYVNNLRPEQATANLRNLAAMPAEARLATFAMFMQLPSGHSVFDKSLDKLGLLEPGLVRDVSAFYNAVTEIRLLPAHAGSEWFAKADDHLQSSFLCPIAAGLKEHVATAQATAASLEAVWRGGSLEHLVQLAGIRHSVPCDVGG